MCIPLDHQLIGKHVSKRNSLFSTVKNYHETDRKKSIQIFTGSPKSWVRKEPDDDDIVRTKKYVQENNINLFIHSLYFINLARKDCKQALESLKWELRIGAKIGSKGVVVHVGKSLDMGEKEALLNMYNNIMSLMPFINPSCPLLLETPAGQGTETLTERESFCAFVKKFDEKLKVCIDSCHVFASGYQPMDYIEEFEKECPGMLQVLHFNDSKTDIGSKKDRHEFPGNGFIGIVEMKRVAQWGIKKMIPMVIEF